jgi:hypothetical protein
MSDGNKTSKTSGLRPGTLRGGRKKTPTSGEVIIHLRDLAVDEWTEIDVPFGTGLAVPETPIRVLADEDLPAEFLVGDSRVLAPGRVRIRICNNGLQPSAAREVAVRILPLESRASLLPEISFDALPEIEI